jgi:hypothetical protein
VSEPVVTFRTTWWERRLVRMFGRKVYLDGKFAGWIWSGRWFV